MQVQNDHKVLSRLVPCLKCIEVACPVLHGHFEPAYLLQHSVLRLDATTKKRYDGKLFKFKKFSIKQAFYINRSEINFIAHRRVFRVSKTKIADFIIKKCSENFNFF